MSSSRTISGHSLLRTLGEGGMGVVYLARDERLGRQVALKLLRTDQLPFEDARARFTSEIGAAALLSHPGIAAVYEVGEDDGQPWYTQEYIEGASLAAVLARVSSREARTLTGEDLRAALAGALEGGIDDPTWSTDFFAGSWAKVCARIARQVGEALQHAHERGVLHGDVKPSNVVLTPGGRAVLVDFGVARRVDDRSHAGGALHAGSLVYSAPELVDGLSAGIDARADVYSLGVSLYELLALRAPFASASLERTRGLVLAGEFVPLAARNPSVSKELATVCACAMAHAPSRRYANAAALSLDLAHVLAHRPITARPPGPLRRLARWSQRRPGRAAAAAVAFLALVVSPIALGLQRSLAAADLRAVGNQLDAALTERRAHLESVIDGLGFVGDRITDPALDALPGALRLRSEVAAKALRVLVEVERAQPDDQRIARELRRFREMSAGSEGGK